MASKIYKNLISIIVVSLNTKKEFLKTIKSIQKQVCKNYEIIVVDGKSTDGTIEIIKKFKKKFAKIVIEEDRGIYDAMNKGTELASGNWVIFLNSGDIFYNKNVILNIFKSLFLSKKIDILFGDTIVKNRNLNYLIQGNDLNKKVVMMPFCHQSTVTKTELLKKNKFDLNYKISSDFNLFLELLKQKKIFHKLKLTISEVNSEGLSDNNRLRVFYENYRILKKNKLINGKIFLLLLFYCYILLVKLLKILLPTYLVNIILKIKYKNLLINK